MGSSQNDAPGIPAEAAAHQVAKRIPIPQASALERWVLPNWGEEFDEQRALEIVGANVEVSKERLKDIVVELSRN